jgi:hypothetical protein
MRMGKTVGIAVALLVAFSMPASAQMAKGKVKEIDKAGQAIVLEDGTRLSVAPNWLDHVVVGDPVVAVYSAQGDKKVVTDLDRKAKMLDGSESTNLGAR